MKDIKDLELWNFKGRGVREGCKMFPDRRMGMMGVGWSGVYLEDRVVV